MNRILLTSAAVLLVSAGPAVAGGGHHHHHFGSHYHGSHGHHYGLHSYHHGGHHYGYSSLSFGLSLSRSYGHGYSYPRNYGYSHPSRYQHYSTPSYRSYGYSYPSCAVQIAPVQPRREFIVPEAEPRRKRIEPVPQAVPPFPSPPNADSLPIRPVSVASHRLTQSQAGTNVGGNSFQANSESSAVFGPQLSAAPTRTLISDESVPFVVPIDEPARVAACP